MDTAIEATGPVEASHPEDTDEHAARPANGAAVAQDTDLPGARPVVPKGSVLGYFADCAACSVAR
jgi:hypothetical protein